jgi:hypothetical protein
VKQEYFAAGMMEATKGFRRLKATSNSPLFERRFKPIEIVSPKSLLPPPSGQPNLQPGSGVTPKFSTRRDIPGRRVRAAIDENEGVAQ